MKGQKIEEIQQELYFIKIAYQVIYWTIYALSWIIIPLAREYESAGDFTTKERLKRAVKKNAYTYLIFFFLGLAFLSYLIIKEQLTG